MQKYKTILIALLIACLLTGLWYFFLKPEKKTEKDVFETPKTTQAAKDEITKERADKAIQLMRSRVGAYDNSISEDWCVDEKGPYAISYDKLRDNMIKVQENQAIARYNFSAYRWDKLREEPKKIKGSNYDINYVLNKIQKHTTVEKYDGSYKDVPEYAKEFDNWLQNTDYSLFDNLSSRIVYRVDETKVVAIMYTLSGKSVVAIKEDNGYAICNRVDNAWPIEEELQNAA